MLAYFIALLTGKGRLSAILSDLEQTRDRLDTFLDGQLGREVQLSDEITALRNQRDDIYLETRRARIVYNNLSNILASPTETTQGEDG